MQAALFATCGNTFEKASPMESAGSRKIKPAMGPAIPISKSTRLE